MPATETNDGVRRIVHLSSVHPPFDIRIFHKECKSLARAGWQVVFVVPHDRDEIADFVKIRGVPEVKGRLLRVTRTVWNIYQESLRQNADLYHFHDPELIPVGLILRARGKKVIYDIHEDVPKDILSKYYFPKWSRKIISWAVGQIEISASSRFSALVAVSPSIAMRFQSLNVKTILVQNFPDLMEIGGVAPADWNKRGNDVAYIGGIGERRGVRQMIEAMALLPVSSPVSLQIASAEPPQQIIPDLVSLPGWSKVRYVGNLGRSEICHLLDHVRAGLVLFHPEPNNLESMPHKLFEYMAAGIPVIASDFPFWRKMLGPMQCCLFVDPLKPLAIAEAIEFVTSRPETAEQMGRRGQEAVQRHFNWKTQADRLLDLYGSLVNPVCAA
jgi:glycosyltransferase involved in cell wall biosynthesis